MDLITLALCRKGGGGGGSFTPAELLIGTIPAAGWSGNTQTVTVNGIEVDSIGTIGLLDTATDAEIEAARKSLITVTAIGTNSVTFKCKDVPEIDINFGVLLPGDSGSGGSSELEHDVTANLTVGAITTGTTLPQGMTFTEFVERLLGV